MNCQVNSASDQNKKCILRFQSQHTYPVKIGILGLSYPRNIVKAICNLSSLCSLSVIDVHKMGNSEYHNNDFLFDASDEKKVLFDDKIFPISFDEVIISSEIDAVYIGHCMETSLKKEYIRQALKNGKHVLIDLPLPYSSSEFLHLIKSAQMAGKYIQDGATFVHNKGIEEFLELITNKERFGCIKNIKATFSVQNFTGTINQYIYLDKNHKNGCIGVLGWICVRMGILIFTRAGNGTVTSAQVTWIDKNEKGIPIDANCLVTFDQEKTLSFECSFTQPSKQLVEVIGEIRSASMPDFALSNNALCFRVREPRSRIGRDQAVERIESVECKCGPHQTAMMLRNFARIVRGIEKNAHSSKHSNCEKVENGGWGDGPESVKAEEMALMSVETQKVVDALMESIRKDGAVITIS